MKKLMLLLVALLAIAVPVYSQGNVRDPHNGPIQSVGAPTGACEKWWIDVDVNTGNLYTCNQGAWNLTSSSGTIGSGTQGQPTIYSSSSAITSSGQSLDITPLSGAHWTNKVASAITQLGANGGTIIVPSATFNGDDGSGTTISIPTNVSVHITGSGTLTFCNITLGGAAKIYGDGGATPAVLLMNSGGSGCNGVSHTSPSYVTLQAYDHPVVSGLRINCNSQPSSTGLLFTGGSTQDYFENLSITGCQTTGIRYEDQFGVFRNVITWNNYVNMKVYSEHVAGATSSNDWYDFKSTNPTSGVGIIVATYGGTDQVEFDDNKFHNIQCQNGTIACVAMINTGSVYFLGGAPEHNGAGTAGSAATVTIDGIVIPESGSFYLAGGSHAILDNITEEDAVTQPGMLITGNSWMDITQALGFGESFNQAVVTDQTSYVNLHGEAAFSGTVQQVASWPDAVPASYYGAIAGSPVTRLDVTIPNFYAGNALTPALTTNTGATVSTANDSTFGPVSTCAFSASAGSASTNGCNITNVVPSQSGTTDPIISVLVKASANTNVQFGNGANPFMGFWFGPGLTSPGNNTTLQLYAGQWTRVLMWSPSVSASTPITLTIFPNDSAGATVSITRVESLAYPYAGSANAPVTALNAQKRALVIHDGSVNPNTGGGSVILGGTDTGSATAYVVTPAPAITTIVNQQEIDFLPSNANSGTTPTLNVAGIGAHTITKLGHTALAIGDLSTTAIAKVIWDGTDFQLQNPQANNGTTTIASGTAALGTSLIAAGACASTVTVSASGVLSTDDIQADFNAIPTSTTGYMPGAMLTIIKYPTSGNVNFVVCNNTGSSITPSAVTLNWRVVR